MTDSDHTPTPPPHAIERLSDGVTAGTVVLALSGEFDLNCSGEFRAEVDAVAREGAQRLVLDLSEVEFMDSSMLKEMLRANAELKSAGTQLVLAAPQAAVRRLLELTRTTELFTVAEDRRAALGA